MDQASHGSISQLQSFDDPDAALRRIDDIYRSSVARLCEALDAFRSGRRCRQYLKAVQSWLKDGNGFLSI